MKNNLICTALIFLVITTASSQTNYDYYKYRSYYNKAVLANAEKKYPEACSNYNEAFKYGNQYLPSHLNLEDYAKSLLATGDTLAALETLKKAVVKGSNIAYMGIADNFSKKNEALFKKEYPKLRSEYWKTKIDDMDNIIEMGKLDAIDQAVRTNFFNKIPKNTFNQLVDITDSVNFFQLKQLVTEKGVNPNGNLMFHVQGENLTFYASILKRYIFEGRISPEEYAGWYDFQRIYTKAATTQIYGEFDLYDCGQVNYSPDLNPIEDIENVDKRRAELGLMPLEDWAKIHDGALPEAYKKMKEKSKSKN